VICDDILAEMGKVRPHDDPGHGRVSCARRGLWLRTRGYGLGWALAMSAFIYAGSMQYVAIDLLTGGASLLTTAVTTLLVNARHLFYGISMLERYRAAGRYAPYLIFSLTDETYSLVAAREDLTGAECFRISLLDQLYWVLGTALGSLAGAYLDFNTTGIDFSLTALFLTVFTEQWLETKDHAPALIGLGVSIVCRLLFGADSFLLPTMGGMLCCLLVLDARRTKKGGESV